MRRTPGMKMKCSGPGVFIRLYSRGRSQLLAGVVAASAALVLDDLLQVVEAQRQRGLLAPDERHPGQDDDPEHRIGAHEQRLSAVVLPLALHRLETRRAVVG